MKIKNLPKITIAIPAKNDANGLKRCLLSIKRQIYPQKKIEIIVIDDNSTDDTATVAKKFGAKVIKNVYNGKKIINKSEVGKALGLHAATGEFYYVLEQDIELVGKNFIMKMVSPLISDETLSGSFAKEGVPSKKMSWVTRYISYNPAQCDPMYEYFAPKVEDSVIQKGKDHDICSYKIGNIPPFGRVMFRISHVKKTESYHWDGFFDLDSVCSLVVNGFNKFAYVHSAGIYHYHADTVSKLIFKRVRNLNYHFFPYQESSLYKWFDTKTKKGVLKIIYWIILSNLFFPLLFRGIYRAIKNRDIVLLADPFMAIATTDVLLVSFVINKDGRKMISDALKSILR